MTKKVATNKTRKMTGQAKKIKALTSSSSASPSSDSTPDRENRATSRVVPPQSTEPTQAAERTEPGQSLVEADSREEDHHQISSPRSASPQYGEPVSEEDGESSEEEPSSVAMGSDNDGEDESRDASDQDEEEDNDPGPERIVTIKAPTPPAPLPWELTTTKRQWEKLVKDTVDHAQGDWIDPMVAMTAWVDRSNGEGVDNRSTQRFLRYLRPATASWL